MDKLLPPGTSPFTKAPAPPSVKTFFLHLFVRQWWVAAAVLLTLGVAAYFFFFDGSQGVNKPIVSFESTTRAAREVETQEIYLDKVVLAQPALRAASVDYKVTAGTAGENDFTLKSGTLRFGPCDQDAFVKQDIYSENREVYEQCATSKDIRFLLLNDDKPEPEEQFTVTLVNPKGLTLGDYTVLTFTILDDDYPKISFTKPTGTVRETLKEAYVSLTLTDPVQGEVHVNHTATGGTAKGNNVDYWWSEGLATFPAQSTRTSFRIKINDNTVCEPDKTVILKITSGNGGIVEKANGKDTYTLTIADNDCPANTPS